MRFSDAMVEAAILLKIESGIAYLHCTERSDGAVSSLRSSQ
jgi:hypothetical protein